MGGAASILILLGPPGVWAVLPRLILLTLLTSARSETFSESHVPLNGLTLTFELKSSDLGDI